MSDLHKKLEWFIISLIIMFFSIFVFGLVMETKIAYWPKHYTSIVYHSLFK